MRRRWTRSAGGRAAGPDPAPASDTALDVEAALRLLPAGQRAALVLVDMLGYPVATAADVLGVSPGTVKSRCARGRARLLPHLAHLQEHRAAPGSATEPDDRRVRPTFAGRPAFAGRAATAGHTAAAGAALPGGLVASQGNPGHPAAPADQRTAGEGGSTDHDRPS